MTNRILTVLLVTLICAAATSGQEDIFQTGVKYYQEGNFDDAIRMFSKIEKSGIESAALYYNLGNAYFKNGDLGRAVLYYHRAKRLGPGDADIINNLEFASQFSKVQMVGVQLNPIEAFLKKTVGSYRLSALGWLLSLFFISFLILLIMKFGLQLYFTGIDAVIISVLCLTIFAAGLTAFKYRVDFLDRRAVILAPDAPVYSGPSSNTQLELQGAPGLVVELLQESGDYYNVLLENKRRGWIKKDLVAEI